MRWSGPTQVDGFHGGSGVIQGVEGIRDAYRSTTVARKYIERRFREPIGALLHDRQVSGVVREINRLEPRRILEIAPGPARVTVDVARSVGRRWTIVDASAQMLAEARRNLDGGEGWNIVQGDAFSLPAGETFDLVYSFRFIRHFEKADRLRLYGQIRKVLRPGGLVIFDAVNEKVSAPLRAANPSDYQHYDALFGPDELRAELRDAGLEVMGFEQVQRRYSILCQLQKFVAPRSRSLARMAMELVEAIPGGEPLEWIVTCRRV